MTAAPDPDHRSLVPGPRPRSSDGVAVTGIGVVSPLGVGRQAFWTALCGGRSGIVPIEGLARPPGLPNIAAVVGDFSGREWITSAQYRRMDRLSRIAVAASRLALDDARATALASGERVAIVFGTALGDSEDSAAHLERVFTRGPAAASPMVFPNLVMNAPAGYVAMELGCTGINFTVAQAEVTGEHAVVLGCDVVRAGSADLVLAGGGDELSPIVVAAYHRARVLAGQRGGREWCSPFDAARSGLVLGEGAAVLVLESLAHAIARNAPILAVIEDTRSFAVEARRYDWPVRADEAVAPLRELAAGIDLICGGANSTRGLDRCELGLFRAVLGARARDVHVTSIKGAIGEFGAAGALTVAAACCALHDQTVPPLCHLRAPARGAGVRLTAGRAAAARLDRALVSGLARGGAGVALALRRYA